MKTHLLKMILKDSTLFLFFSDIDVIEWHEFLTPQLKLSKLFKAKPQGDVSYRLLSQPCSTMYFQKFIFICRSVMFNTITFLILLRKRQKDQSYQF